MGNWTWAAASRCGTAHSEIADRRQDAFRIVAEAPAFLIAVACDGAGSASHGRHGAVIAARVISSQAKAWVAAHAVLPTSPVIERWVDEARLSIAASADRIGCITGDFASTLVLAISNGTSTVTAHIGDGAIVARCATTTDLVALSWPEGGEYAATTYFITDPGPRLRIGMADGLPVDRLAIFTDGVERLALDFAGRAPHRPFFDRMFDAVAGRDAVGHDGWLSRQLGVFLDSSSVNARTDDDKTLLLAALT